MFDFQYDWHVAIYCHNEERRIAACIAAVDAAIPARRTALITVIVNGSTDGSLAAARNSMLMTRNNTVIETMPFANKSHAINAFIHKFAVRARLFFCVDGYVVVQPGALLAMADAVSGDINAVAASGQSVNGRSEAALSASTLLVGGEIRGGLYCLDPAFVSGMRSAGIRLPVGLYRGDSLLAAMARHNLDATKPAQWSRVLGVPQATYEIDSLSLFKLTDIRRHFWRKVRQMRGRIENLALTEIIYSKGFRALPANADQMILDYLDHHPLPKIAMLERPFMALALRQVRPERASKALVYL